MPNSTFQLTVPQSLYDTVCDAVDQPFADSYLYGARYDGHSLTPRTLTGYRKMMERSEFRKLVSELGMRLVQPTPFPGAGDRLTGKQAKEWS